MKLHFAFLGAALLIGGCHATPDACASYSGQTCISLEVKSGSDAVNSLSQIAIESTSDLQLPAPSVSPSSPAAPFSLPIVVAILPGRTFAGSFELSVQGVLNGNDVANGSVSGSVASGQHVRLGVSLTPTNEQLSGDMSGEQGVDMAGSEMSPTGGGDGVTCTPGAKSCSNKMLSTCNSSGTGFDLTTCAIDCNSAGTACQTIVPTQPALPSDFQYDGLTDVTFTANQSLIVFDTTTGAIVDGGGNVIRPANFLPSSRTVLNGIGFYISGVAIWTFSRLTIPSTATVVFKGGNAPAILSDGDLTVAGNLDLRGYGDPTNAATLCMGNVAGPSGALGGTNGAKGGGTGGGAQASTIAGGGGGGFGDPGGNGGSSSTTAPGGSGGPAWGNAAISPFGDGGSGGAAGGATGGGGGGAIQLAALGTLTFSGTVNAGGCGGTGGGAGLSGGGGGSGGAILLEAPTVHLTSTAILAANGGGAGAGNCTSGTICNGQPGQTSNNSQANGGGGAFNSGYHQGGSGDELGVTLGAGSNMNGASGSNGGGGGGGGVGRVRVNSATGSATVDNGSQVSPAATQGTVTIQ